MKKLLTLTLSGLLIVGLGAFTLAQVPQNPNPSQPQTSFLNSCPWHTNGAGNRMSGRMGSGMMRPGMMGSGMMGSGMMRHRMMNTSMIADCCVREMTDSTGYGARGMSRCPRDVAEFNAWKQKYNISTPLNRESAKRWVEYYVAAYNNPDLTVGKIKEKETGFEVEIRSKKEDRVLEKVLVDKKTGWIAQIK